MTFASGIMLGLALGAFVGGIAAMICISAAVAGKISDLQDEVDRLGGCR